MEKQYYSDPELEVFEFDSVPVTDNSDPEGTGSEEPNGL